MNCNCGCYTIIQVTNSVIVFSRQHVDWWLVTIERHEQPVPVPGPTISQMSRNNSILSYTSRVVNGASFSVFELKIQNVSN